MEINYFGVFLLLWLGVGFISSMKKVYLDKEIEGKNLEEKLEKARELGASDGLMELLSKKSFNIVTGTLLGFWTFYRDTVRTFKKSKDISN